MIVKVDAEKCMGCGLCTTIAGEVFEMADEMVAKVKEDADLSSKEIQEKVEEAAKNCPAGAIKVEK